MVAREVAVTALVLLALGVGVSLATGTLALAAGIGHPRASVEVPATAMDQAVAPANNSPVLVADPGDARFVVMANRLDAPDFGCALQLSSDGGGIWAPAHPVPALPPGADKCYAPEVAFDRTGRLYFLFVGLAGKGNHPMGAFLATSADRGRSFNAPRPVLGPANFAVRMAIDTEAGDRGRLHLVWLHTSADPPLGGFTATPNPILSAYSDDAGATFSEPVQVSDPDRTRVVAPALVLGADHGVQVAYYDLGRDAVDYQGLEGPVWDGTWSVVVSRSTDAGQHFSPGTVVDDKVVPYERVMLIFTMPPPSFVTRGDRSCLAWADARYGDADAVARCSADGGRHWDAARRINDDPIGNGARQYLPRLALAPGGRLDAVFYDRRDDPRHLAVAVYYTYSVDGAKHFAPNMRITTDDIDPRIGQQYANVSANGQVEFGSRLGLLSRPHGALMAWTDTRNSKHDTTGQDIFAATVALPSRPQPGWARLVGVALVGAAVVGVAVVAAQFGLARGRRRRAGELVAT